ncbi:uncharacterized protein LOC122502369 [Leptopilina heterotoma]|uniref:uncharacterized protein LOC122502369 n=1 Tax=Leptopilina heterotoma TaxID=63436 RepID=UPI001CA7D65E|nr:uncharacterized protein LOC122502369 [Leptopilina heterotoma]
MVNFPYEKLCKKSVWMESTRIAAQRDKYLITIKLHRDNGCNIFYTDETWCGVNHSRKFGWIENFVIQENNNFDYYGDHVQQVFGQRSGFFTPSGAGKRVIILHIGGKFGFDDGGLKCFVGKKGTADYHDEMNAKHKEWFRYVLTVLPSKSVIVLDQAPYNTMLDPEFRNPTNQWLKSKIVEWLIKREVNVPEIAQSLNKLSKQSLLEIARPYHFPKQYLLEKIVNEIRSSDVKLLWLPVAHCEYNPIELIWAYTKNYVTKHFTLTTFKNYVLKQ